MGVGSHPADLFVGCFGGRHEKITFDERRNRRASRQSIQRLAADMPVKAPSRRRWWQRTIGTGCYIGGNIGYSWGRARGDINTPDLGVVGLPTSFPISQNLNGVIGGDRSAAIASLMSVGCSASRPISRAPEKNTATVSVTRSRSPSGEGITGVLSQNYRGKDPMVGTVRGRAGLPG